MMNMRAKIRCAKWGCWLREDWCGWYCIRCGRTGGDE